MSLTQRLNLTAPPPKVVLLPDCLFFVRTVEVPPTLTGGEVAAHVELALEGMAPFPVAQMYHGHHWREGFAHALVFAAYRKRFTAEQTDTWGDAEFVAPAFAALLNAKVSRATTVMLTTAEGLTAIHWENPDDAPVAVLARLFTPETDDAARARARDDIFRTLGGTRTELDLSAAPTLDIEDDAEARVFKSGNLVSGFSREDLDALDVRDKADLASRRQARARDLILWRSFIGCLIAIGFTALLELAMIGGEMWEKNRIALLNQRTPVVEEIKQADGLAQRVEELSTKRLLPFEMMEILAQKKPESVLFTEVATDEPDKLAIKGTARESSDVVAYRAALAALPGLDVTIEGPDTRNGVANFRMTVFFKPDVVKPEWPKAEVAAPIEAKPVETAQVKS